VTDLAAKRLALERLINAKGIRRVYPSMLLPAGPYFDLAGEEFGRRLVLTLGNDGVEYCLRPEFTLPMAQTYLKGEQGPAALSYLGPVFRQRDHGPVEFEQAGLELLAQADAEQALDRVFQFASDALAVFDIGAPAITLGSVAMFEALLAAVEIPDVWRPRIRHRFGHPQSLASLLQRLADPHGASGNIRSRPRDALIAEISGKMVEAGLSLTSGRSAEEIADRFLEKQALAAAYVPGETIELLSAYLEISGSAEAALGQIAALISKHTGAFSTAMEIVAAHAAALAARAPGARVVFDAGFSPRLDYYTGVVFEMRGAGDDVLASGGQYSRLLQRLGAGRKVQAAGCAVWVGRLEREANP